MMHLLFRPLSPAGSSARLQILIFHRVLPAPDPLFPGEVDARCFDRICGWLRDWFNVLPLDQAVRRLRDRSLPERALAITFDDGYADNHDLAMPILQRHGLTATFFIATGFLDGGRMWNDTLIESVRRTSQTVLDVSDLGLDARPLGLYPIGDIASRQSALRTLIDHAKYLPHEDRVRFADQVAARARASLPDDLMMSSKQVVLLARGGMQIGAHTVNHPILANLGDEPARGEVAGSRAVLQGLLDAPVTLFAYPNGRPGTDYRARDVDIARELGFEAAVSTAWGASHAGSDTMQLPRFTPWDRGRLMFAQRLWRNLRSARGT